MSGCRVQVPIGFDMKDNKDYDTLTFNALKRAGYNFAVTLPCGMLKGLIRKVEDSPDIIHVPLAREEEGVGIAAGAHLGGKKPVMIVQSSGVANALNSITSLSIAYQIPLLIIMSYRGSLHEFAPAQVPLGLALEGILRSLGVPFDILDDPDKAETLISGADSLAKAAGRPVAILLARQPKGTP
jgi:sulfopyruvate decarboxylase subunit alpha